MTCRERLYPEIKRLREVEGLQWREIGGARRTAASGRHDYATRRSRARTAGDR
jgi:hypothetical protein